jgi:hypothetical protein
MRSVLIATTFAVACPLAMAGSVSAELSDFRISLTDLAPDDGIVPGFEYDPFFLDTYQPRPAIRDFTEGDGSADFIGDTSVAAQAFSRGSTALIFSYLPEAAALLTPFTKVTITANARVAGSFSDGEFGRAIANIDLGTWVDGVEAWTVDELGQVFEGQSTAELFKPLSLSFSTGADASHFAVGTYVQVNALAQAIPEPETYALMLSGLLVVGWAAKRRSFKRQPRRPA